VRFITNLSSGKMGYALARIAYRRGAEVTLITGPSNQPLPQVHKVIRIRTAQEMYKAVLENFKKSSIIIKAAAVADYCPAVRAKEKIKKGSGPLSLTLERNPDIISEICKIKGDRIIVGFAMETQNLLASAREKLKMKNMDLIVANSLREEGAGFQTDTNVITIIDKSGKAQSLPKMTKIEAAEEILNRISDLTAKKGKSKK
jgi:phosphopantothenoylcysteine decarboxylase/phosphopantothenate--cysteine ligase